jgi:hypothetical protein
MPGISTEYLAEQIKEANQRHDEVNNRLADEIRELGHKFDDFRVEVAKELGSINANLEGFRGRTDTSWKVAVWAISMATIVAISLIGSVVLASV